MTAFFVHWTNITDFYYYYMYFALYNNQINARALIGQSAMVYCAGKPMTQ